MSYLALYRRFRPVDFNSVIGQEAIVKTLTNQIKTDRIGHAYLFCGTRGTGKTTLAKIFARAVNCTSPVNGSPCLKCATCKALADSNQIDVVEMDAASNNKVENVRDIRENVQYPPVEGRYKVYIIDEVHMLTTEAFNALLKTLEEPPKHAIFILATTEPHKIPATILSRCMRFDFKLVPTKKIASLISGIYDEIGKKYTEEAIMAIAKAGEGSVRDALSVADLCVSLGEEKLTFEDVANVLGATDINKTDSLVSAMLDGDIGKVLSITDELSSLGKSIGVLVKDIIGYLRDIFIVKTCKNAKEILTLPDTTFEMEEKTSKKADEHRILRILEIVSGIETSLRFSTQPRSVLETALIKASMPENDYNFDALISRISALEKELSHLKENGVKEERVNLKVETIKQEVVESKTQNKEDVNDSFDDFVPYDDSEVPPPFEDEVVPLKVVEPPKVVERVEKPKTNVDLSKLQEAEVVIPTPDKVVKKDISSVEAKRLWGSVIRKLRTMTNKTILWVACQEISAYLEGDVLVLSAKSDTEKNLLNKEENYTLLQSLVKECGNYAIKVSGQENKNESVSVESQLKEFLGDTLKIEN